MAVTKRTRFEVLRRDEFRCRYCGATPAEDELTVDHVVPVALGGSDAPDNLVAACRPCNSGKASSSPDESLVANVSDDALRWALAMRAAQQQLVSDVATRDAYVRRFVDAWMLWDEKTAGLTDHWESTVRRWCDDQFPVEALVECVNIAMGRRIPLYRVFPYVCGIVRNRVIEMQEGAKKEFNGPASEPECPSCGEVGCLQSPLECAHWHGIDEEQARNLQKWGPVTRFDEDLRVVIDGHRHGEWCAAPCEWAPWAREVA